MEFSRAGESMFEIFRYIFSNLILMTVFVFLKDSLECSYKKCVDFCFFEIL